MVNQVKHLLIIRSICFFSVIIFACSEKEEHTTTSENTSTTDNTTTVSNGLFVAAGTSGYILTSSDGTSWDNRSSGTTSNLIGITYGNSKFLTLTGAIDNGSNITATVLTSSDGSSWTSSSATCSSCGTDNISLNDVTYTE